MPHDLPLIATLAAAFGFALVLGFVADMSSPSNSPKSA
jgi:predicted Kef-type K+ transport protein